MPEEEEEWLECLPWDGAAASLPVGGATETTDASAYNRFNAKAFLVDLDQARAHVVREFPCIEE